LNIDTEEVRRHYASLSDEALLAVDLNDLTEEAQHCYCEELAARNIAEAEPLEITGEDGEAAPEWLDDAACACAFSAYSGSPSASDAAHAREVLQAAGIPAHVSLEQLDPSNHEYRVMVPGAMNLQAASVLDLEIFNPEVEAGWRTHFEALTDEEVLMLNADVLCAGLRDRVKRLETAYEDEIDRRGLL
jgi:hypothetical protein